MERKLRVAEKQRISDRKPTVKEESNSNGKLKSRANDQSKADGGGKVGIEEVHEDNGRFWSKGKNKDGKADGRLKKCL